MLDGREDGLLGIGKEHLEDVALDVALRQLKRRLDRLGLFPELRRRQAAESPGARKRRKRRRAQYRARWAVVTDE